MMAWPRLLRLALAPGIAWDWAAGILLAGLSFAPEHLWLLLILLCVYHGGMVGNDLADRAEDKRHARRRPLTDGSLRPSAAIAALILLWGGALALAAWVVPAAWTVTFLLVCAAAIYDFGSGVVRAALGPALLAAARATSLLFVPIVALGSDGAMDRVGLGPPAAYAIYFLFLSRLARREERGAPAAFGFTLIAIGAAAPLIACVGAPTAWPAWLAAAAFLLWRLVQAGRAGGMRAWSPEQVRAQVRASLAAAPLVPAIALLTRPWESGLAAWAPLGLLTLLAVRTLARILPPE